MKRIVTIAIAVMILCLSAFALAEETKLAVLNATHEAVLKTQTPVTVQFMENMPEGYVYAQASREDLADVHIVIVPSEVSEGVSMKDLDEEGKALFKSMCAMEYADPVIEEKTTPAGNLYIKVCSNEASDIDSYVTLFEGYLIQLDVYHPDFSPLTDADHAFVEEILTGIWINEIGA